MPQDGRFLIYCDMEMTPIAFIVSCISLTIPKLVNKIYQYPSK